MKEFVLASYKINIQKSTVVLCSENNQLENIVEKDPDDN